MRVCVIGGGIIGLISALRLSQRGAHVTVLERGPIAREASWAAAGILGPLIEEGDDAARAFGLCSRALYPSLIAELADTTGVTPPFAESGVVYAHSDPGPLATLAARAAAANEPASAMHDPRLAVTLSARFLAREGWVEPRSLCQALALACARAGVEIVTEEEACAVRIVGDRVSAVQTSQRARDADSVLVAAGAWSSRLPILDAHGSDLRTALDMPEEAITPVKGVLVRVTLTAPLAHVYYWPGGYAVPRPGLDAVIGTTAERVGFDKSLHASAVHDIMTRAALALAELRDAPVREAWSGLRPAARGAPELRATAAAGLFYATGHYRNGILHAPLTGERITALMLGEAASNAATPAPR